MDLLKVQLERLQKQLAGLTATQRMLTAALAAIMIITVVWWGKYAGESETVPLLNQSFSASDLGRIEERLDQKGIHYTVSGDKLMGPADRRMEILSDLTYSRVMPRNTQEGFESMLKQMSPFDPEDKQNKLWNHGKEVLLGQIIGSFPDVSQADVIISDSKNIQRIEGGVDSSATVNIMLRDGAKVTQKLVDAAADLVAGAESDVNLNRIKVVVNGMAQRVHDSDNPLDGGSDQLALLQQNEAMAEEKVRQNYSDITGLLVTVTMKLNTTSIQTEKHDYDAKGAVQKTIENTSETDQTSGPAAGGGGEAGAVPNTGMSVGPSPNSSGGSSQSHEKTQEKNVVAIPETRTVSRTPAGEATAVGAAVRVPLSYFSRLFQARDPSTKEPSYLQLKPLIDEEIPKMRETVARCVALASPTDVSIDTYVEATPSLSAGTVAPSGATSNVAGMIGGHAKELALGALAVMSLFMASMMVRKSTPSPVPATVASGADGKAGAPGRDGMVGETTSADGLLDGLELNEETVRTTQMVNQVSTLVRENPEAAAALVKRWLNRA